MSFKNKVAIVTGAGQGIGEVYAKRLAAEGASVVVAEINAERGRIVADEIVGSGGKAVFVPVDVSDPAACIAMADQAKAAFGGVDYLVNNAAIFHGMRRDPLMTVDADYYLKFMAVNVHGVLWATRAVAPLMEARGGGAIVNQSSTAAYRAGVAGGFYGLSKLAVNGLTMHLAKELGPKNIRVNAILPGPTDTEALRQLPAAQIQGILDNLPLGRLGVSDDQANGVLFLLSDQASWVTGQMFCVDGGMILKP